MTIFAPPYFTYRRHKADENHYTPGRSIWPPQLIVLHATGGTQSEDYLTHTSPASNPVSAHIYIPKSGEIVRLVEDNDTAWTQGPAIIGPHTPYHQSANAVGLSVEMENLDDYKDPWPDSQVDGCATICTWWWALYGFLPIVSHQMIQSNKHDPAGFPWPGFYSMLAQKLKVLL